MNKPFKKNKHLIETQLLHQKKQKTAQILLAKFRVFFTNKLSVSHSIHRCDSIHDLIASTIQQILNIHAKQIEIPLGARKRKFPLGERKRKCRNKKQNQQQIQWKENIIRNRREERKYWKDIQNLTTNEIINKTVDSKFVGEITILKYMYTKNIPNENAKLIYREPNVWANK